MDSLIKNWKLISDDTYESEYTKKFNWKNTEIEGILIWEKDSEFTKEELSERFDKITENLDFWIEKSKNKIVEEFIDYVNYWDEKYDVKGWINPKYTEIYYKNHSLEDVENQLLKIIEKKDTDKIMNTNTISKEAFKKLLGNEYIEIWVNSNSDKDEFTICLYENIFFTEKAFTLYWNLNGELIEYYMD